MFGLEDQKKKKPTQEFIFELEKDLKDPVKYREILELIERRLQRIKEVLRSGDDKEDFDRFGLLLQGYTSLTKVMGRTLVKKK